MALHSSIPGRIYEFWMNILLFLFNQILPDMEYHPVMPDKFKFYDHVISKNGATKALPNKFGILVLNIEKGYQGVRLDQDILKLKQDIMLLQEVPCTNKNGPPGLAFRAASWAYIPMLFIAQRSERFQFLHAGISTMSDTKFLKMEVINMPEVAFDIAFRNKKRYTRRVALYTQFKTKTGTIGVYNAHLENLAKPSGRRRQAQVLIDAIKKHQDTAIIIAGDFNTIAGKWEGLIPLFEQAGFKHVTCNGNTCGPFVLDHIFCTSNLKITAEICDTHSSDHKAIKASVELLN